MNIRQLYIFQTVCKHLSFTKAAKELYMSQPAISHTINDLEKELHVPLLDRIGHKIYVNATGQQFLQKASQILELYNDLENHFATTQLSLLRVGSSITLATFLLPKMIQQFSLLYPHIHIEIEVDSARNIEQRLIDNKVDIAFIEGVPKHPHLIKTPISSFSIIAIAHPKHPLASRNSIPLSTLLETPLLLREKGSAIRDLLDSTLLIQDMQVTPSWTSVNSQVLIEAVKQNLGITFLPELLVEKELKAATLKKIEIENLSLKNTNHLVYHKDKPLHPDMKIFIDFCRQYS